MNIAILTSPGQWFEAYVGQLSEKLNGAPVYTNHKDIEEPKDVVFILSYHTIIDQTFLVQNQYNIVVHESALPEGKGWAPLFWQVLEGKIDIPFTMFEASDGIDNGPIYFQEILSLTGYELNDELREKQAGLITKMCLSFVENYSKYLPAVPQNGTESFYRKRSPVDSQLDVNKTIKEQFNLLRVVNNQEYPAFFEIRGKKYKLTIEHIKE